MEAVARWLHGTAVEQVGAGFRPAAAVIGYGVNCITSGEGSLHYPSHRVRITELCGDVVRRVIETLSLDTITVPVILGVIPHANMEGEALDMCRTLSSMYAFVADVPGAVFIAVESVVANASPSGDDAGGAEATGAVLDSDDESVPLGQRRILRTAYVLGRREDTVHLPLTSLLEVCGKRWTMSS